MPALLILGIGGLIRAGRQLRSFEMGVLVALLLTGIGYIFLLKNAAYEHDFLKIFLTVSLAIAAGAAFVAMMRPPRRLTSQLGIALCLASWIGGVIVWGGFQLFGERAEVGPMIIVQTLDRISQPESRLLTNLETLPIGIEYYAFRNIDRSPSAGFDWNEDHYPPDAIFLNCDDQSTPAPIGNIIAQDAVCTYLQR